MKIDLSNLSGDAKAIAKEITKANGEVYKTKPKKASLEAQYVWREFVFVAGKNPAHHCMPVNNEFIVFDIVDSELGYSHENRPRYNDDNYEDYMKKSWERKKEVEERLNKISDEIIKTVPPEECYGLQRWASVLL